jgi:hypothetical protein
VVAYEESPLSPPALHPTLKANANENGKIQHRNIHVPQAAHHISDNNNNYDNAWTVETF